MERYRFGEDAAAYFVTFSVVEWLPVFVSEAACQIVVDSFNFCHAKKNLRINAYVIMPTHLHAIVFDENWDAGRLEQTLVDMRKFTGRKLIGHCAEHGPRCFHEAPRSNPVGRILAAKIGLFAPQPLPEGTGSARCRLAILVGFPFRLGWGRAERCRNFAARVLRAGSKVHWHSDC
jgi:hypothetical protein